MLYGFGCVAMLFVDFAEHVEGEGGNFNPAYESKNIPDSYDLWVGDIGADAPVFCVVSYGKSAEDFFALEGKHTRLLGEEVKELNLKVLPLLRKYETKTGMPRPEQLPPPKEM